MVSSPSHGAIEKKHWWLTNKKIVDMYVKDARSLIASQQQTNISSAINLLDAALALSPRYETAMELKASSLLHLRSIKKLQICFRITSPASRYHPTTHHPHRLRLPQVLRCLITHNRSLESE
ncbi:hypothetical protein HanHA300_Chr10g0350781 [Helianthus annuus]|nr:hypothetical protein HanHA300_Chr10g0350781 [Helianthus annuus]